MKRILFITVLLSTIIGCKKGEDVAKPNANSGAASQQTPCVPSIVLDRTTISNYTTWLATPIYSGSSRTNSYLICKTSGNYIDIDLSRFDNDSNESKKAVWLKDHKSNVYFQGSKDYIKSSHIITSAYTVVPRSTVIPKTVGQIKGFSGRNSTSFGNDSYDNYLKVDLSSGTPIFEYVSDFVPGEYTNKAYYSTLFLRCLTDGLADNKNIEFNIAEITKNGTTDTKTVVVVKIEGTNTFYDMTKWPTKKNNPL